MTVDDEYARRYEEAKARALVRGHSLLEQLDREQMLLTRQRRRALIEDLSFDLGQAPLHVLAAQTSVALEAATFADGVRAAAAWMERRAKE